MWPKEGETKKNYVWKNSTKDLLELNFVFYLFHGFFFFWLTSHKISPKSNKTNSSKLREFPKNK